MKNKIIRKLLFPIVILSILVAVGCMLDAPIGTGSVVIQLPSRASASAALTGIDYDIARIGLRLTGGRSNLEVQNGLEYVDVTEDSVTIEGLLPDSYTVQISFGSQSDENNLYSVTAYGQSDPFRISAGVPTKVTVQMKEQVVFSVVDTVDTGFVSAVTVGPVLYTLSEDGVLYADGSVLSLPELRDRDIQSLSLGGFFASATTKADELWINTDKGIFPYRGGSVITDFSSGMNLAADESLEIVSTFFHMLDDPGTGEFSLIVGIEGSGLENFKATYMKYTDSSQPSQWEWHGWDSLDGVEGLGAIKEALAGVGDVVYDLVLDDDYIYAATALQTLFLSKQDLEDLLTYFDGLDDIAAEMDLNEVLSFFYIVSLTGVGDAGKAIKTAEVEGSVIYLGTNTRNDRHNGVLAAGIDPTTGKINEEAVKIAETDGYDIMEIVFGETAGVTVARAANAILVLDGGVFVEAIPHFAGLPGLVTDVEWQDSRLYVTGTEGTAYIDF